MNPSVILTGYATHGKDQLIKDLQSKRLSLVPADQNCLDQNHRWFVWGLPDALDKFQDLLKLFDENNSHLIKRYALADSLKVITHEYLKLNNCPANAFENVKETMLIADPNDLNMIKTIRGWYIKIGQDRRQENPLYWSEITHKQIEADKFSSNSDGIIDIISDSRFKNEPLPRKYPNGMNQQRHQLLSIRVHREGVHIVEPLPYGQRDIDSEHNLDETLTDFLFCNLEEESLERFPQYIANNYCRIATIYTQ